MKTACQFCGSKPGENHPSWCPNDRTIEAHRNEERESP